VHLASFGSDTELNEERHSATLIDKKWKQLIHPFRRRRTVAVANTPTEDLSKQQQQQQQPTPAQAAQRHGKQPATILEPQSWENQKEKMSAAQFWHKPAEWASKLSKKTKSLAQYPHYDDKWAVGRVPSTPNYTPYPYRQYVGGKRVLAQYGHHDDKWAAG